MKLFKEIAVSRFKNPWTSSAPDSKPTPLAKPSVEYTADYAMNPSATVFKTIEAVSRLSPLPVLREAAMVTISVVNTLNTTKCINHKLRRLAQEISGLVIVISRAHEATPTAGDLIINVEEIVHHLSALKTLSDRHCNNTRWNRFLYRRSDARRVAEIKLGIEGIAHNFLGKSVFLVQNVVEFWNEENTTVIEQLKEMTIRLEDLDNHIKSKKVEENIVAENTELDDHSPEAPEYEADAPAVLSPVPNDIPGSSQEGLEAGSLVKTVIEQSSAPPLGFATEQSSSDGGNASLDRTAFDNTAPPSNLVTPAHSPKSVDGGDSKPPKELVDRAFCDTVIDNSRVISNSNNNNGANSRQRPAPVYQIWKDSEIRDSTVVSHSGNNNNFSHLSGANFDYSASTPMWYPGFAHPGPYSYPFPHMMYPQPPGLPKRRQLKIYSVRTNPTRARKPRFIAAAGQH